MHWKHCRWFDPHPPIVREGSYVPHVRATGLPSLRPSLTIDNDGRRLAPLSRRRQT